MSKRISILAVLGVLSVSCLAASAVTISSDEPIVIALGGSAQLVGLNSYSVQPGTTAILGVKTSPNDFVWCFAVGEDPWGEADYSHILTLMLDKAPADGLLFQSLAIPAELSGLRFYIQAVAVDEKGELKGSEMLTVVIPGSQILLPDPKKAAAVDPVLEN